MFTYIKLDKLVMTELRQSYDRVTFLRTLYS